MPGDSPYRRPERPAQLVTDERITAHIDTMVWLEMKRRLGIRRRRRIYQVLRWVGLALGVMVSSYLIRVLSAYWLGLLFGSAVFTWGLLYLITAIPPRSGSD